MDKAHKAYCTHLIAEMRREAARQGWKASKGAVMCSWDAFYPTKDTGRLGRYHHVKPDRDNIDKTILDCAQKAGIVRGDQQFADGRTTKTWCPQGCKGLLIVFRDLTDARPKWPATDSLFNSGRE
jgi:Holliday junction resolvase RusA-like endonuclease